MVKLLALVGLLVFLVSCNQNPDCSTQTETAQKALATGPATTCPEPGTDPDPGPDPEGEVPNEALIFDADYKLTNFSSSDEEKLQRAIEIIKKVVASNEFRKRVYNFTYQGKRQFVDNKGLTNEEIYQVLLDGKEDLVPEVDHAMDLELELYYSWTSTVGYTTPGQLKIFMNTKFFNPYTATQVAGNVFHEWTHKLGFDHASSYSVSRDSSVPYAIGYLIEELGKQYE